MKPNSDSGLNLGSANDEVILAASRTALARTALEPSPGELQAALAGLTERLDATDRERATPRRQGRWERLERGRGRGIVRGALFAVLVMAFATLAGRIYWRTSATTKQYATTTGERAIVHLADGTRITLAPQTSLTIVTVEGRGGKQDVTLVGEAYFNVVPRARVPFTVRTGHTRTQVLGTEFSVRRYQSDSITRVAVASGRVSMGPVLQRGGVSRPPSVVLSAGMVGSMTDSTVAVVTERDITPYVSWLNGQLTFRDAPVPDVLAVLGRWYGYQFQLSDSVLVREHLSNTFAQGTPDVMLRTLRELLDVDLSFNGTVVTLVPRRPTPAHAQPRRESRDQLTHSRRGEAGR